MRIISYMQQHRLQLEEGFIVEFEQFENLTEEQKAKLRECKTKEEFVSLLEEEDVDLSDDMLETIAGGESPCTGYYGPDDTY